LFLAIHIALTSHAPPSLVFPYLTLCRFLCGRRKGAVTLLGCPWSAELDADPQDLQDPHNPLNAPESLVSTARRALLAHTLLDTHGVCAESFNPSSLVKLCDIRYHRPKETIKGKLYPEQVATCCCCCCCCCCCSCSCSSSSCSTEGNLINVYVYMNIYFYIY
jgi:hypothetical protein